VQSSVEVSSVEVHTAVLDAQDPGLARTSKSLKPFLDGGGLWRVWVKSERGLEAKDLPEALRGPNIDVQSGPDESLYDALNKLLARQNSYFFFTLGSGDVLIGDSGELILRLARQNIGESLLCFGLNHFTLNRGLFGQPKDLMHRMSCPHPSTLISTQVAEAVGGYSRSYQIAADYDLICRVYKYSEATKCYNYLIVGYQGGGMSEKRGFEGMIEEELIRHRLWGSTPVDLASKILRHCVGLIQRANTRV